ncbi:MAG: photosystem II reaction center protein Ycf12 [Cyanobacteria bacterium P01_A01_bin.37]
MDSLISFIGGINFETIIQLILVAAIMISGPVVIFLLAASKGDL